MTVSVEYLKKLGACWTQSALEDAAKLWPSPTPTWSWFLGERLEQMTPADALLRLQCAASHMRLQGLNCGQRPGVVLGFFRDATPEAFRTASLALGAWLDLPTDPSLLSALQAALGASK